MQRHVVEGITLGSIALPLAFNHYRYKSNVNFTHKGPVAMAD